MLRTHTCGQLREKDAASEVTLCGWVHRRRDHGGLIFVDLRDRYGFTQIVFAPENKDLFSQAEHIRPEWVIQITGAVTKRLQGAAREDNPTGAIEVRVRKIVILNEAKTPPFEIDQDKEVSEELRLEYRYLDLRRERMRRNIVTRHKIVQSIRKFFYDRDFIEVETPILIKGTPEGSREYLVPSRLYHGQFYVLPQSPQQLKQLTMVAGLDRYMQIARCFRDEDQRGDRQPEFTQVDVEMSFVEPEDVMSLTEQSLVALTREIRPDVKILKTPFPRLTYSDAMNRYGSDKPDLRFDLKFTDVSELCKGAGFSIFAKAVESGGVVKCLRVPDGAASSRKEIDELTEIAKIYGAKGLAWIKIGNDGYEGVPVDKLGKDLTKKIVDAANAKLGDILFFTADSFETACSSLGAVRTELGKRLKLIDPKVFAYCWVTDFPMFEKDKDTGAVAAVHHPFTRPKDEDRDLLDTDPIQCRAAAYDIVLNGSEIGGGSIRIHEAVLQSKIFEILKIAPADAERRFGHLLRAFQYGAPPHGGIAWGVDRIVMLFCDEPNIREVIAYPKDQKAKDLMLGSPSVMSEEQIVELGIKILEEDKA
ncbi:MAG: aspartyl-tRNA synthetase [Candidatus Peregrinibacteria bacterium Greene0416_62]|nr:MAG: aspartyl-tRNA synthetase [Candidatus Peregrinibacteria bacterium Greene0416_62]TSC97664.1 MAG: aspartyl-tRNA synthetase [Candidatus Peregrinibacteria bacterium Greene1014_49]